MGEPSKLWPRLASRKKEYANVRPVANTTLLAHGLAIQRRCDARHAPLVQDERSCHTLCREAGLRVFCAGAQRAQTHSESVRGSVCSRAGEAQDYQDEVVVLRLIDEMDHSFITSKDMHPKHSWSVFRKQNKLTTASKYVAKCS